MNDKKEILENFLTSIVLVLVYITIGLSFIKITLNDSAGFVEAFTNFLL